MALLKVDLPSITLLVRSTIAPKQTNLESHMVRLYQFKW